MRERGWERPRAVLIFSSSLLWRMKPHTLGPLLKAKLRLNCVFIWTQTIWNSGLPLLCSFSPRWLCKRPLIRSELTRRTFFCSLPSSRCLVPLSRIMWIIRGLHVRNSWAAWLLGDFQQTCSSLIKQLAHFIHVQNLVMSGTELLAPYKFFMVNYSI